MARLIIKDRGKGKTTQLLYTSATTGYPIVTSTCQAAQYLLEKARELELNIPSPITVNDLKNQKFLKIENVLIDEAYDIIGQALNCYLNTNVIAATFSDTLKADNKYDDCRCIVIDRMSNEDVEEFVDKLKENTGGNIEYGSLFDEV